MNKLLTTTALVGVLAFAAPALAGHYNSGDSVLNFQLNVHSATSATGVLATGATVDITVGDIDVTAIGNLNETDAFGGGSEFSMNSTRSSTRSSVHTSNDTGNRFALSYSASESSGSRGRSGRGHGGSSSDVSLSVSGSAWTHATTSDHSSSRMSEFSMSRVETNRISVSSKQLNIGSPTTAIGVDLAANGHHYRGGVVTVNVGTVSATAVGNMNSTRLR